MRHLLKALLLVGLCGFEASAQPDTRRVTRQTDTVGTALIAAPNSNGGGYGCPACLLWAGLDADIEPDNPLAPVRVRVDGREAFVWLHWKRHAYFEVPVEVEPGRSGMRRVTVEIGQGEQRFVGSVAIVAGAPILSRYEDGTVAGLWQLGDYGAVSIFWFAAPAVSDRYPTRLLLNVANLGVETLRRGKVDVWIGARRFVGTVSDSGFVGISAVGLLIEPGQIEPGEHSIRVWSGRWSGAMPSVRFVAAGAPVSQ